MRRPGHRWRSSRTSENVAQTFLNAGSSGRSIFMQSRLRKTYAYYSDPSW
jgi:hypothetical protein